jgi:hypothetical protein
MRTGKQINGAANSNGTNVEITCESCGAMEPHTACPVCSGRGCIAPRELAERLGLRDALESTELTAHAVAKALDGRVLECFEAARKIEQQRCDQVLAAERSRLSESEHRQGDERKRLSDELTAARQTLAQAEARARQAEESLAKRRQHPAALGRVAERDFASMVGDLPDFRISAKLPRTGDYEVWLKTSAGAGPLVEIAEPVLVDVKRESAALQEIALARLVRDCKARGRIVGVMVADRLEEVSEIFGSPRVRTHDGVTVLLTSVDAFASDMRLLGPYMRLLVDASRDGNETVLAALLGDLGEISKLMAEIERQAESVALALEKQATILRDSLVERACGRARKIVSESQQRLQSDGE